MPVPSSRSRRFPIAIAALFIAVVAVLASFGRCVELFTDYLWWSEELGQAGTFRTLFVAEYGWGMILGLAAMLFMGFNLWLARRRAPAGRPDGGASLARVGGVVGLFWAFSHGLGYGRDHWREILLWTHRKPFGISEPIFGRDAGFYVFEYPFLSSVVGWVTGFILITMVTVTALYLLRGASGFGFKPGSRPGTYVLARDSFVDMHWNRLLTHISVLGVFLVAAFMAMTRLSMWGLMHSARGVVHGPGYTDVHVMVPALNTMLAALAIGGVLLLLAVRAQTLSSTFKALRAGVALTALVWFLGIVVVPGLVQRYRVAPNETTLEIPYVRHNMDFTRLGFGLTDDTIELRDFPPIGPVTAQAMLADSVTLSNARLWDWRALEATYDQNQSFRQYYDFFDVDIDRYRVNGDLRQVMLSLRELNIGAFSANATTWVNRRLIYTHGYGLCMNPTNEFNPEGLPNYWIQDIPPAAVDTILHVDRPEIYFGELMRGHVYVNSAQKEFDYPRGDENVYATYAGKGGVRIGTGFRRLLWAIRFDGLRQLTSGDINADTRLIFRRQLVERLEAAAPFLELDSDPYAVVAEGRLYLFMDAYTTSSTFPYSERLRNGLNYIRNSVKITVDCYDGTTRFYIFDPADPIVQAWSDAFPGFFEPADAMPAALRDHVRYPEDFLSVQSHVYATYHMTDPLVFYNKEDRWALARETLGDDSGREMIPYYAVMKLPGEEREEYVQLIPFTPFSVNQPRNNMVAWMAGRCDGDEYGKLLVYRFPKQTLVYGPMQIEARIDQDAEISKDLTLWNQQGSSVIRGNLIVLPLQDALLYTEPIFLQATHSRMPELKRVVVASQERLGYGSTYPEALADLLQAPIPPELESAITGIPVAAHPDRPAGDEGSPSAAGVAGLPDAAGLERARGHYRSYLELTGKGRTREAGEELERLGRELGVSP